MSKPVENFIELSRREAWKITESKGIYELVGSATYDSASLSRDGNQEAHLGTIGAKGPYDAPQGGGMRRCRRCGAAALYCCGAFDQLHFNHQPTLRRDL